MQYIEGLLPPFFRNWIDGRKKQQEKEAFLADRTFQILSTKPTDVERAQFQSMVNSGEVYIEEGTGVICLGSRSKPHYKKSEVNLGTGHFDGDNPGKVGGSLLWQMRELAGWKDPSGAKTNGPDVQGLPEDVKELVSGQLLVNVTKAGYEYDGPLHLLNKYIAIVSQPPSQEARDNFNLLLLGHPDTRIWLDRSSQSVNFTTGGVDRRFDLRSGQVILEAPGVPEFQIPVFIYLAREWAGLEDPTGVELLKAWLSGVDILPKRERE